MATGSAIALLCCSSPLQLRAPPIRDRVRPRGDPGTLKTLAIETGSTDGSFSLDGRDASRQLVVSGRYSSGQTRDLTRAVRYESEPVGIVQIDATGLVTAFQGGQGDDGLRAKDEAGAAAEVVVTVSHLVRDRAVSFANEVVPIFTKFGCNAGGCHGKADGQNGFKLSLLGFEPADDFEYLTPRGTRPGASLPPHPNRACCCEKPLAPSRAWRRQEARWQLSLLSRPVRRWIEQGASPSARPTMQ